MVLAFNKLEFRATARLSEELLAYLAPGSLAGPVAPSSLRAFLHGKAASLEGSLGKHEFESLDALLDDLQTRYSSASFPQLHFLR